jgi:hypothetical protein
MTDPDLVRRAAGMLRGGLAEDNRRLRARIAELEGENERLRAVVGEVLTQMETGLITEVGIERALTAALDAAPTPGEV